MSTIINTRLADERRLSHGATRPATVSPKHETDQQREQHEQHERSSDLHRVDLDALEQQRQHDGHVADREHHEQHHQANGKGEIALGDACELRKERRAGGRAEDEQSDA